MTGHCNITEIVSLGNQRAIFCENVIKTVKLTTILNQRNPSMEKQPLTWDIPIMSAVCCSEGAEPLYFEQHFE